MFYRLTTAKRVVAVCGMALTVLSCAQQSHAFCRLTGCQPSATSEVSAKCCHCCPQAKSQHLCDQTDENSPAAGLASICGRGHHAPSCPSPGDRVCCQNLPTPSQSTPTDTEFLTTAAMDCTCSVAATTSDIAAVRCDAARSRVAPERSIETCVRLCRMLV